MKHSDKKNKKKSTSAARMCGDIYDMSMHQYFAVSVGNDSPRNFKVDPNKPSKHHHKAASIDSGHQTFQ
jgi:hypothetical protein